MLRKLRRVVHIQIASGYDDIGIHVSAVFMDFTTKFQVNSLLEMLLAFVVRL